ncbi:hypothetical protein JHK87_035157 [Glycine soja]|nr:hypothetical protein JHK87_035157 [Glycine soja]
MALPRHQDPCDSSSLTWLQNISSRDEILNKYKVDFKDNKPVDLEKYTFSLTGRKPISLEEKRKLGEGYIPLLQTSILEKMETLTSHFCETLLELYVSNPKLFIITTK